MRPGLADTRSSLLCSRATMTRADRGLLVLTMFLLAPGVGAQTLDELQQPLLGQKQIAVSADYSQFAFERHGVELGTGSFSYFEPPNFALVPNVGLGLTKDVQLNVSSTYLFPVLRSDQLFAEPDSTLASHWLSRSFQTEVLARPSDRMELAFSFLTGRSRYDSSFPSGNGTSQFDTLA